MKPATSGRNASPRNGVKPTTLPSFWSGVKRRCSSAFTANQAATWPGPSRRLKSPTRCQPATSSAGGMMAGLEMASQSRTTRTDVFAVMGRVAGGPSPPAASASATNSEQYRREASLPSNQGSKRTPRSRLSRAKAATFARSVAGGGSYSAT